VLEFVFRATRDTAAYAKTNLNDDDAMLQIRNIHCRNWISRYGTRTAMQSSLSRANDRKILIYSLFNCIILSLNARTMYKMYTNIYLYLNLQTDID